MNIANKIKSMLAMAAFSAFTFIACTQDEQTGEVDPDSLNVKQDTTAQYQQDTAKNELASIMNDMHMRMMAEQPSGNIDKDFAQMMAIHHEGAAKMSDVQLSEGKDSTLKMIAQKLKDKQTKEADQLENMADKIQTNDTAAQNGQTGMQGGNMQHHQNMMQNMQEMMQKVEPMAATQNTDSAYAAMMIEHHKSGIKMAEMEQKNGKNPEIKRMASKIISDQKKEIQELEKWLKNQNNLASR